MLYPCGGRAGLAGVFFGVMLLAACSSEDSPSGPGKEEPTPSASATVTLSVAGGTVRLADGTAVVFPPGAAPAGTRVTLAKGDPATFVDGPGEAQRVLLQISAGVAEFTHEVEIRVPLPASIRPAL